MSKKLSEMYRYFNNFFIEASPVYKQDPNHAAALAMIHAIAWFDIRYQIKVEGRVVSDFSSHRERARKIFDFVAEIYGCSEEIDEVVNMLLGGTDGAKCDRCGEVKEVEWLPDPFINDVYDEEDLSYWCEECYSDRADEV